MSNGTIVHEKSIASVFFKYVCFYTAGSLFWLFILFMIFCVLDVTGNVLPANHMEAQLNESADSIRKVSKITDELIPEGCVYGVYEYNGSWLYGTFSLEEREEAWEHYKMNNIYTRGRGYYRFFMRDMKEICIVRYEIAARFQNIYLRKYLPGPDILMIISFVVLFIIHTFFVSSRFGKYMKSRLRVLNEVTGKIRNQNLEFEEEYSELKEIDEVLSSLYQMREALKDSLYRQWNLEKIKDEQVAALAHDIKTPLTVVKGNAELLAEEELEVNAWEYNQDILRSVSTIEEYLSILNEILFAEKKDGRKQEYSEPDEIIDKLKERVRILGTACQCHMYFRIMDSHNGEKSGWKILCNVNQILRAFDNILYNAIEYTPLGGQIQVVLEVKEEQEKKYLVVSIADDGPGFTKEDLKHAAEQFYQGDKSRNSKNHYGIGLYTAQKFIKAQGGHLLIENKEEQGARVSLYIALCRQS